MSTDEYRILLVEDDGDAAGFLLRAFEKADSKCVVRILPDGAEAIEHLSRCINGGPAALPTLVITDLKMPRKTGFDVVDWIRHQPSLSKVPVVVLTCSDNPSDVERAMRLGANGYFEKPLSLSALVDIAKAIRAGDFNSQPKSKA